MKIAKAAGYGPSGTFTKAAKLSQPITNFFHKRQIEKVDDDEVDADEIGEDDNNELEDKDNEGELEDNDYIELENKNEEEELGDNDEEGLENKDKELRDYNNDELKDKDDDEGLEEDDDNTRDKTERKIDNFNTKLASLHSAKIVYDKGSYKVKQIRIWAKYWIEHGTLPKSLQGCHQKIKSIIDDKDVIERSLLFICEKERKTTLKEYQTFVEEVLFLQLGIDESKRSISIKTSCVWLKKLGLIPQLRKKGIYFDEQKNPVLLSNKKLHILITHDKCLFYANDDKLIVWAPIGEPHLRKKGQGKSIMVSDFLLEKDGRLKLNENKILLYPEIPVEARKFLRSGKNEEGWWTAKYLLD
ncbi:hypothetical protein RclHR1_23500001 [Rhizophagus clarus]|uniref:Uncharacterized protein n=1 Tax=Rhizophagus clarus TaxID=94130 RepID=A0A2Z6RQT4_9GLOM|nr:hypothetical protein RclHR1_23500001 [Rhizophagus clarus]